MSKPELPDVVDRMFALADAIRSEMRDDLATRYELDVGEMMLLVDAVREIRDLRLFSNPSGGDRCAVSNPIQWTNCGRQLPVCWNA